MSTFAKLWTAPTATSPIPAEEEATVIAAAQTGDQAATLRLFAAYQPALRAAVRNVRTTERLDLDDARQAATVGFLEAVHAFDPEAHDGGRLAGILRQYVADALTTAASDAMAGFTVPTRTLKRFFGVLAKADRDPVEAARIAPDHAMSVETFWAVWAAVDAEASLDQAIERHGDADQATPIGDPVAELDTSDEVLVQVAFASVDDFERDVCRLHYGFADFDPVPDAEIGFRLGGFSRLKIQRTRTKALDKMRSALAALNV